MTAEGPASRDRGWYTQQRRYALDDLCQRLGLRRELCDLVARLALDADWRTGVVSGSTTELAERYGRGRKKMSALLDELADLGVIKRQHHQGPGGLVTIMPWLELVVVPDDVAEAVTRARHADATRDAISVQADAIYRERSRRRDAIYQDPPSYVSQVSRRSHTRVSAENADNESSASAAPERRERSSDLDTDPLRPMAGFDDIYCQHNVMRNDHCELCCGVEERR